MHPIDLNKIAGPNKKDTVLNFLHIALHSCVSVFDAIHAFPFQITCLVHFPVVCALTFPPILSLMYGFSPFLKDTSMINLAFLPSILIVLDDLSFFAF